MSDWKEVKMPPICERQIGFSIPEDNQFLVVSYEGTHLVTLGDEISVEHDIPRLMRFLEVTFG